MRRAARDLEFERAAALRDEIQQIRLRCSTRTRPRRWLGQLSERRGRRTELAPRQTGAPSRARRVGPNHQARSSGLRRPRLAGAGEWPLRGPEPEGPDLEVTEIRVCRRREAR